MSIWELYTAEIDSVLVKRQEDPPTTRNFYSLQRRCCFALFEFRT